ncbi:hypothetical protein HG531_003318 [Fusarium graminearum]|nr:hypothetical protein HG531_003318 [Fusarium graminearum]
MGRRDTYSEPPRGRRQSRRQHPEARREHKQFQKERGFDWTPGLVLALIGAVTFFSKDFDRYKHKHEWRDEDSQDNRSRDDGRGRRRYRSSSRRPDYYEDDDDYYYDRRDRGAVIHLTFICAVDPHRDETKPRRCEYGKNVSARGKLGLQTIAKLDAVANLERAEASTKRDLPVAVISNELVIAELVAQIGWLDAESLDEPSTTTHPDGRAVKGGEKPLVGMVVLLENECRACVGSVDVHPDFLGRVKGWLESLNDTLKVIDGAYISGAKRGSQEKGLEATRTQVFDGSSQSLALERKAIGLGDGDSGEADAKNLSGFLGARGIFLLFAIIREVSSDSSEVLFPRSTHVSEDSLTGTAMDDTSAMSRAATEIALWKTQCLRKPVHDNGLKLGDCRTADPVEVSAVEGVGVHLSQSGRVAGGAREEGHETRA